MSVISPLDGDAQRQRDDRRPGAMSPGNFGLTVPQEEHMLPRSNVPVVMPERKAKVAPATVLEDAGVNSWNITGGWEMTSADAVTAAQGWLFDKSYDTSEWYNATVPGTVLTTLVDQGVYPDPYYGINNMAIPDTLCRTDWWYRTEFVRPATKMASQRAWLVFDGINYRADIWLNGVKAGSVSGAFKRGRFDVTGLLKDNNILAVHIYPPYNPGIPHEQSVLAERGPNGGQLCLDGPTFISSEGWDWIPGIRDRNIGIWQDVKFEYTGEVTLGDFRVATDLPLPDTSTARLTIKGSVTNHSTQARSVTVKGVIENIAFEKILTVGAGETASVEFSPESDPVLTLENPRLWWPNGYGAQELYTMELSMIDGESTTQTRGIRFGVRELSYEITADVMDEDDTPVREGVRFEYNPLKALAAGKPVFDNRYRRPVGDGVEVACLLPDVDPSLLDELPKDGTGDYLVIKVNGVRIFCRGGNWGMDDGMKRVSRARLEPALRLHRDAGFNMIRNWTGESTEEIFYELCDEYGMLVWNDFWVSTEGYNLNPNDENLFMENAADVVRRFANHPSIAVWCPRNEGYAPPSLEVGLNELIARQDGTRLYHGNSRYLNLRPSGGWYYCPAEDYFADQAHGFNTEIGSASVPTVETLRSFIPEEDLWPVGGDAWHFHDWHFGQTEYLGALNSIYGEGTDIEDFVRKAQMVNYDNHRAMFEAWNSRLWNSTTGVLLWMSHPAWPSVTWQTYSSDYETTGAYFGSMKACEPLHIQMNADTRDIVVVNTSRRVYRNLTATMDIYDLEGTRSGGRKTTLKNVAANALTECFEGGTAIPEGTHLVRLVLKRGASILSINDYVTAGNATGNMHDLASLPEVTLSARETRSSQGEKIFEISNPSETVAVSVKLNLRNTHGERILPAYFSDGYFNLLPGERRTVSVECGHDGEAVLTADGFNIAETELLKLNM